MSTEGLAALVCSYKNRVVAVEGAICKAPEDGPFTRVGAEGQCEPSGCAIASHFGKC